MKTLFTMNRKRDVFLSIVLSLFIISLAICFTVFFKQLYYFDIEFLNISKNTGLSSSLLKTNYDILIQYQSLFYRGDLYLPNFPMSEFGRIHFVEVKRIFEIIQILCITTGLISLFMIFKNIKDKEYRYLRLTSILTVGLPTILGMLASIDFNKAFIIFHKIFFRNDYWIFDATTDPIIMALPETFFMHCFMLIILLILLGSTVCYAIYRKKRQDILA